MKVRAPFLILLLQTGNASLLAAQSRSNAFMDVTIGANVLLGGARHGDDYYETRGMPFAVVSFGNQPDANRHFWVSSMPGFSQLQVATTNATPRR